MDTKGFYTNNHETVYPSLYLKMWYLGHMSPFLSFLEGLIDFTDLINKETENMKGGEKTLESREGWRKGIGKV